MNSAIILAGGKSARMGFDKQFLQVGGVRLMDIMVAKLSSVFDEILISTNKAGFYESNDNPAVAAHKCTLLRDTVGIGPLAGIYSGLTFCKSEYLYVIACDMPFISLDYIGYMQALTERKTFDACVARRPDGYYEPFNALYSKSALPYIEDAITNNRYGINRLLDKMNLHVVNIGEIHADPNMFFNYNYKEDLPRRRIRV